MTNPPSRVCKPHDTMDRMQHSSPSSSPGYESSTKCSTAAADLHLQIVCRFQPAQPGLQGTAGHLPLELHQALPAPSPCAAWQPCSASGPPSQSRPQKAWSAPSCACVQLAASLQNCRGNIGLARGGHKGQCNITAAAG